MTRRVKMAAAACLLLVGTAANASDKSWSAASDIGRDGLVLVALGLPAVRSDWTGTKQAAFSIGAASLGTQALKRSVHEERPDLSDDKSFPSGHTSVSFAAAATLEKRDGWQVGIPAHVAAAFVAVARVKADKHFIHDVIAGAAVGEASGWIFTGRKNPKVKWLPWGDAHGAGMTVAMKL